MIWVRGLSAPSVSLQMTPSWAGVSIGLGVGRFCRGIWTDRIDGQGQLYEVQEGQVPRPALWSQQPHALLQAEKLPGGKGPGGAGRQTAEHEPAVCPGGQEGQQHPGLYQE